MIRVILIVFIFNFANARIITGRSSCHCRYSIQKERDNVINKLDLLSNEFENFKKIITLNKCNIGYEIDYDSSTNNNSIICKKCQNNYYRAYTNTTCLHCPEGFISNNYNTKCIISKYKKDIHTLCPIGTIIGTNPYAEYGKSCLKCDYKKREYISQANNEKKCNICPNGSIINSNICIKCPIGYYEKNNKCIECSEKSYNDIEGSSECKICNNENAIAYYSIGGINCQNNIIYNLSEKINKNIIDIKIITDPIIKLSQISIALFYNNRFKILDIGTLSLVPLIGYTMIIY